MTTTSSSAANEARYALSRHIPDMGRGFVVVTGYGELPITDDEVRQHPAIRDAIHAILCTRLRVAERGEAGDDHEDRPAADGPAAPARAPNYLHGGACAILFDAAGGELREHLIGCTRAHTRVHGLRFGGRCAAVMFDRMDDPDTLRRHAAELMRGIAGAARAATCLANAGEESCVVDDLAAALVIIEFAADAAKAMTDEASAPEQVPRCDSQRRAPSDAAQEVSS